MSLTVGQFAFALHGGQTGHALSVGHIQSGHFPSSSHVKLGHWGQLGQAGHA